MLKTIWLGTYSDLAKKLNCISGYWDCTDEQHKIFKTEGTTLRFFEKTQMVWCHGTQEEMLIGLLQDSPMLPEERMLQTTQAVVRALLRIETALAEQFEIFKALHITITEQLKNDRNHS